MSTNATTQQVKAVNAYIAKAGQMENKAAIISQATKGRTCRSSELSFDEAKALLSALAGTKPKAEKNNHPSKKMIGKLFAMAHEIGWIKEKSIVGKNGLEIKKDYSTLHDWITTYGYLNPQPLNNYTYDQLPRLVSQFETHIYKNYISKL